MRTATQMIFYKSASVALEGTASGADYQWPGTALSANTVKFYGDLLAGGRQLGLGLLGFGVEPESHRSSGIFPHQCAPSGF